MIPRVAALAALCCVGATTACGADRAASRPTATTIASLPPARADCDDWSPAQGWHEWRRYGGSCDQVVERRVTFQGWTRSCLGGSEYYEQRAWSAPRELRLGPDACAATSRCAMVQDAFDGEGYDVPTCTPAAATALARR